jgi:hypothetical protein
VELTPKFVFSPPIDPIGGVDLYHCRYNHSSFDAASTNQRVKQLPATIAVLRALVAGGGTLPVTAILGWMEPYELFGKDGPNHGYRENAARAVQCGLFTADESSQMVTLTTAGHKFLTMYDDIQREVHSPPSDQFDPRSWVPNLMRHFFNDKRLLLGHGYTIHARVPGEMVPVLMNL